MTKLMGNKDLVLVAAGFATSPAAATRWANRASSASACSPTTRRDDLGGILLATIDGLLFGCGDAVIGVNPATDSVDTVAAILRGLDRLIDTLGVPTQACCLAHITTQLAALDRGAPVDLLFQSVAGTQAANASFGVTLAMLREGRERVLRASPGARRRLGRRQRHVLRDRPGQRPVGRRPSRRRPADARGAGLRRRPGVRPVPGQHAWSASSVRSTSRDERQITRAGLEDHFMGKLLGLPMGCDVCYTNHAEADQNSADNLLLLLAAAGCNYVMGVPCADDVMLNYQSHELPRRGRRAASCWACGRRRSSRRGWRRRKSSAAAG